MMCITTAAHASVVNAVSGTMAGSVSWTDGVNGGGASNTLAITPQVDPMWVNYFTGPGNLSLNQVSLRNNNQIVMTAGTQFSIAEPPASRTFSFSASTELIFNMSEDCWFEHSLGLNPPAPASYLHYTLQNVATGAIINLPTTPGVTIFPFLRAGDYRVSYAMSGSWTEVTSFFGSRAYGMTFQFTPIPAPTAAAMLCFGGPMAARRRRG
jgi:hypothetical protein